MPSKITLSLPTAPGPLVSTTIKNSKFVPIHRTPLGPLPTNLVLEPGYYIALVEFPDGRCFDAAFEVPQGNDLVKVELEEQPTRSDEAGSNPINREAANADPPADAPPARSDLDTTTPADSVSLITIDNSGQMTQRQYLRNTLLGTIKIEQGPASRFVKITRAGQARDLFIAAPTSVDEGAELEISSLAPLTYEVKLENDRANLLLNYIASGRVDQLSELVADVWPKLEALASIGSDHLEEFFDLATKHWSTVDGTIGRAVSSNIGSMILRIFPAIGSVFGWGNRASELRKLTTEYQPQIEALLKAKGIKPIVATVAGYVLLLVGPPPRADQEKLQGDAIDLLTSFLFGSSPWLADQHCIRGELLARQGQHEKALSAFLQVPSLGSPMFSMGLRYALDRLKSYRTSTMAGKLAASGLKPIEEALDRLQPIGAGADFTRPLLTFELPAVAEDVPAERERFKLQAG